MQASSSIIRKDKNTGTWEMSFPRRFKIHAISYRELIRCTCAPFSFITSRILPNLEAVVSPLYSSVKIHTFSVGSCGLSVQISFTRSFATNRLPCFFSAIFAYAAPSALERTLPSNPITPPCGSLSSTNSFTVGTPSSDMRYSVMVLPASCCSA